MEAQNEPAVFRGFRLYIAHGDALAHGLENFTELLWMVFIEVLRYQRDVVATSGKVLGVSDLYAWPRVCDVKVGNVPVLDEITKF